MATIKANDLTAEKLIDFLDRTRRDYDIIAISIVHNVELLVEKKKKLEVK